MLTLTLLLADPVQAGTPAVADPQCDTGMVATAEGRCCWPAQGWNGASCVGAPICPAGLVATGYRCGAEGAATSAPRAAAPRAAAPRSAGAQPMTGIELYMAADWPSPAHRARAHAARLASIEMLKELVRNVDASSDQKAEMILRLADLYFEEGRDVYMQEVSVGDVSHGVRPREGEPPITEYASGSSSEWLTRSTMLYRQILANHPSFPRTEEAMFFLASSYLLTGQADAAEKQFRGLVERFPESAHVPDAYVLLGELAFDEQHDPQGALADFRKAAAFTDRPEALYAAYRIAWCYYELGDATRARAGMAAVAAAPGTAARDTVLKARAARDLALYSTPPAR